MQPAISRYKREKLLIILLKYKTVHILQNMAQLLNYIIYKLNIETTMLRASQTPNTIIASHMGTLRSYEHLTFFYVKV